MKLKSIILSAIKRISCNLLIFYYLAGGLITTIMLNGCGSSVPAQPDINASQDPAIIERGRYLVYGPAGCARCHIDKAKLNELQAGIDSPLTGGLRLPGILGDIYSSNITPHPKTGLGTWSDGQIARAIRHGVDKNDQLMAPMMEYPDITDADLLAIVSYLRSIDPLDNAVSDNHWSILGQLAKVAVLKPQMPSGKKYVEPGPDKAYGEYLAKVISHCVPCHTERNLDTGQFIGAPLAGGTRFLHEQDPTKVVVSPNITRDKKTGRIAHLSEAQFLARMRAGPSVPITPMPWAAFRRTTDTDLRAIYRYLMTAKAVEKDNSPALQALDQD